MSDMKKLLEAMDSMSKAETKPTGPKFPGYWKGTDSASKAKDKMVGGCEESIIKELDRTAKATATERKLKEEFENFQDVNEDFNSATCPKHGTYEFYGKHVPPCPKCGHPEAKSRDEYYKSMNAEKYGKTKDVAEGAPELLKAEMPLVRHIEKELAQHGYEKGTPEYNEVFKHTISMYRKFGNVDAIKKGVAEGQEVDASVVIGKLYDIIDQQEDAIKNADYDRQVQYATTVRDRAVKALNMIKTNPLAANSAWKYFQNGEQGVAEEWSEKYKHSINCNNPKGFSQKAHCAGRKKHDEGIEEAAEGVDTITVDVPLLIRLLEYAREDAQTDMDLHDVAERLIDLSQEGRTLTMQDYDSICPTEQVHEENIVTPNATTTNSTNTPEQNKLQADMDKQHVAIAQNNLSKLKAVDPSLNPGLANQALQGIGANPNKTVSGQQLKQTQNLADLVGDALADPQKGSQLATILQQVQTAQRAK